MSVIAEPKIDCHMHVLDPTRFPYNPEVAYKPAGQEIGTPAQYDAVMDFYGVTHALIVQPNSGYGSDNALLLDTIARGKGRFKGVAIIDFDASMNELRDLQAQGIVGAAFNPSLHGSDYYSGARKLVKRLAELGMYCNCRPSMASCCRSSNGSRRSRSRRSSTIAAARPSRRASTSRRFRPC